MEKRAQKVFLNRKREKKSNHLGQWPLHHGPGHHQLAPHGQEELPRGEEQGGGEEEGGGEEDLGKNRGYHYHLTWATMATLVGHVCPNPPHMETYIGQVCSH